MHEMVIRTRKWRTFFGPDRFAARIHDFLDDSHGHEFEDIEEIGSGDVFCSVDAEARDTLVDEPGEVLVQSALDLALRCLQVC
jgi:hypothetical protein